MKFESEIELVSSLINFISKRYDSRKVKIYEQVSLGYGIADLVISEMNNENQISFSKNTVSLNSCDINIFDLICSSCEVTENEILNITRAPKNRVENSINKLFELKYIKEENGFIQLNRHYEYAFNKNYAIEAKLKNWRSGLKQAYRYKWFAEYSYLIIDEHYCSPAVKNINLFKEYNIGLASFSVNGLMNIHFRPKLQKPIDNKMRILLSEKVKVN